MAGPAVPLPEWEGACAGHGVERSPAQGRCWGTPPRASGAAGARCDGSGSGSRRSGLWGISSGAQAGGSGGGTLQRAASDVAPQRRCAS